MRISAVKVSSRAMSDTPSLAGPLARISRADELSLHLTASCRAFLSVQPYTIEERPDEDPTTRAFVITALSDVPVLLRILAGEIARHLRASLDLMVYQRDGPQLCRLFLNRGHNVDRRPDSSVRRLG